MEKNVVSYLEFVMVRLFSLFCFDRLKNPMTRNWMPNVIYLDLFSILNIFVGMKKKGGKGTILCTKDYYFASECHVNNRSCLVKQSFIRGK